MGERNPRWTYVAIFALLVVVVALAARALKGGKVEGVGPTPRAEKSAEAPNDKDRQIQDLNIELAQLRKDVEANSARVQELESKLDATNKALAAAQQKLKVAQKQTERAAAQSLAREKTAAKSVPSAPPTAPRRAADAGSYEIVHDTAVLERPSPAAREVALIQRGTTVNVVGSQGDWLEVRSKYGKPPGYIRREDAILRQGQAENR
jgi:hypothetical protein